MTYDAAEVSVRDGSPIELFEFAHGSTYYRWTNASTQQEFESEIYEPAVISRSAIDQSQEDSAGNIKVTVPRDNPVAALHVPYLPTVKVSLIIRRFHRLDNDLEVLSIFVGSVLSMKYESETSEAILTCGPVTEALRKMVAAILHQPQCNHALYSPGCGIDKDDFKETATITAIDDDTITSATFATFPDGYFNNGWVQKGEDTRWIVNHVGAELTLMNPFTDLAVTDEVDAYPGCDRTEATCLAKFNNLKNHLGFSRVPLKNPYGTSVEY